MINKVIPWFQYLFWIVLIFFIGVLFIFCSSKMNEHLLNQNYIFEFKFESDSNNVHLLDFVFHYDFTKNKGNISFNISESQSIDYLRIEFPVAIDNTTLEIYTFKNGVMESLKPTNNSTSSVVYHFKEKFSDGRLVIDELKFKPNLEPNGWFRFRNEGSTLHYSTDFGNVHFVFGGKYECVQGCIHDLKGILEIPYSSLRDLRLNFTDEVNLSESSFKISSINRWVLFLKNLFLALGVALLVSSMMVLLQEIKICLQKRDDKDKFQEFSQGFLDIIKEKKGIAEQTLKKIDEALSDYIKKMERRE